MRKLWTDPFLWIQVAAFTTLPLWVGVMLVGLAIGDPILPVGIEQALVALAGIVPVFAMQWYQPFYPFSLGVGALSPDQLSGQRRSILSAFWAGSYQLSTDLLEGKPWLQWGIKSAAAVNRVLSHLNEHRLLTLLTGILLLKICEHAYEIAPLFASLAPQTATRLTGLTLGALGFLGANFCLQIPLAVARILLFSDQEIKQLSPLDPSEIGERFTVVGKRSPAWLLPWASDPNQVGSQPSLDHPSGGL
jgi:hypothetical protein